MRNFLNKQHGFTLLELIVAMAIMALMLAILYQTFNNTIRSTEIAYEENEIYGMAHMGFQVMTDELQSAFWASDRTDTRFIGSPDSLEYTALSRHRYGEATQGPDLALLRYYLETAPPEYGEDHQLILFHEEETNLLTLSSGTLQRMELGERIKELGLSYFGEEGWIDYWDAGEIGKLPKAVEIRLVFKDKYHHEHEFFTRVEIPIATLG